MRVYHFLSAEYALDDIRRSRIKIATFDALNDPFELWAAAQPKDARAALRRWKTKMSRRYGVLCFCRSWHSPLLWSHYADKHHGMVLGFDVRDDLIRQMDYVSHRPVFTMVNDALAKKLLFKKYADWQYEQEWRIWSRLEDRDPATQLFFADFDKDIALREVIAGPLCEISRAMIERALRRYQRISVIKARLAFRSFRVVKNRLGFGT